MKLFSTLKDVAIELLDLQTTDEIARQERTVNEMPMDKQPMYYEDGNTTGCIYVGRNKYDYTDVRR